MTSARPAGHSPRPHVQGPISQTQGLAIGHSGSVPSVVSRPLPRNPLEAGCGAGPGSFVCYCGKIHIA